MEAIVQQNSTAKQTQKKRNSQFIGKHVIQRKLTIGSPDDAYEREADAMADKVLGMSDSQVKTKVQTGPLVQRKCTDCEEEMVQTKSMASQITPLIQSKGNASEAGSASQALTQQIDSRRGTGQTMDKNTQSFMESRFGASFAGVRIHTDAQAAQMNRDLNAQAFTVGNDIYFNEGKYNPHSNSGKHLLAHELTHTLQQSEQFKIQKQENKKDYNDEIDTAIDNTVKDYDKIFESQKLELQIMYKQIGEADPPKMWQKLLMAGAELALVGATAGIGSVVAVQAGKLITKKLSTSNILKNSTISVIERLSGDIVNDVTKAGINKLTNGMKISFAAAENSHPVQNKKRSGEIFINSQVQNLINNMGEQGKELRKRKSTLKSKGKEGLEAILAIQSTLNPSFFSKARRKQRNKTVQNWSVFLAKSDYGTTKDGTVNMKDTHIWDNLGVLQVFGEWHNAKPTINSAKIDGINQHLKPEISKTKIKNLKIPIRCTFDVGYDVSWYEKRTQERVKFSRDEKNYIWLSDTSGGFVSLAHQIAPSYLQLNAGRYRNFYTLKTSKYKIASIAFKELGDVKVKV